ncbi:ubiquitin-like protein 4A isoform X1 [Mya arenaria]|uniref:ubiquitin-like protein 4A isoform X1 n=1 Tax=Mya arenaria TaxID=6604 RepID=UPI0022E21745|nr:ubiquitin-like protein 4A isoform X1 [Mya arenaria]
MLKMRLNIKVLKGSECAVSISPSAVVHDVKVQLQNQISIPVDQQKLVFQGKALADDKALSYYKVTDGSKLYLMLKRPGGGMTPATCSSTPSHSPGTTSHMDLQSQEDTYTVTRHNDPTGFWRKLHTFLKRHFTERDAARVIKEFEKQFDCGINSLSLDDIERLASRQLHPTLGYSEQPIS